MKTINKSLLLFLFTLIISSVHAQQNLPSTISTDTLCFCREKLKLNGKVLHYKEMKSLLTKYPSSSLEFKRYMRGAGWTTLALFTGVTGGVVALARIPKKDPFINRYTITFFSGTIIGFAIPGSKHLKRAALLYNKEVLK